MGVYSFLSGSLLKRFLTGSGSDFIRLAIACAGSNQVRAPAPKEV